MAVAQPGVTLTFAVPVGTSIQLSIGLQNRHGLLITNNDPINPVSIGFGTNNAATASMHVIPGGGKLVMGESQNVSGAGPQAGSSVPVSDIAAVAVTGSPGVNIAFTEW